MDDRVLVYRGADQPDMSVINPESDVWQRIKASYYSLSRCVLLTQRLHVDTPKLLGDELANTLLGTERRW